MLFSNIRFVPEISITLLCHVPFKCNFIKHCSPIDNTLYLKRSMNLALANQVMSTLSLKPLILIFLKTAVFSQFSRDAGVERAEGAIAIPVFGG
jgi:hypothetical protein